VEEVAVEVEEVEEVAEASVVEAGAVEAEAVMVEAEAVMVEAEAEEVEEQALFRLLYFHLACSAHHSVRYKLVHWALDMELAFKVGNSLVLTLMDCTLKIPRRNALMVAIVAS